MFEITLKNNRVVKCAEGQTILDAALTNDIVLEYSCRTGRCGVCKAKVVSGDSSGIRNEDVLSQKELLEGYILTCCRAPKSNMSLGISDLEELKLVKAQTSPCRIKSLDMVAPDVMCVTLRTPPSVKLNYLPGQYLDVIAKNNIRRSYSIANASREDGCLELHVRKVPDGRMSDYWFNEAQVDDLLRLEGPLGTFYVRNNKIDRIIFLATGTGIGPVKAMLEKMAEEPVLYRDMEIYIYWGGRVSQDMYWDPDFPELNLRFIPVLSRPEAGWNGRVGYIQNVLIEDEVLLDNCDVYACGSEMMIHSAKDVLLKAGLVADSFYSDAFVSSN